MCIPIDICDPKNNYNKIIYSFTNRKTNCFQQKAKKQTPPQSSFIYSFINYNCYLIFHMWVRLEHVTSSRFKYSRKQQVQVARIVKEC